MFQARVCVAAILAPLSALAARPVDVAIIGGGPCGLATAVALCKARCLRGATVEVFERDAFGPKGASIQISEPGWAALTAIDAEAARRIRLTGAPVTGVSMRTFSGVSITPLPIRLFGLLAGWFFWGLSRLGIRRGVSQTHLWHDVREVLRQRAAECGAALRPSKHLVEATEHDAAVRLRFGDGDAVEAKVVLACDGTRSACRRLLPSEPDDLLVDERKSVWRGQAAGLDTGGEAIFFRDDDATGASSRSGLVFPAGSGQGSSWSLIADSVEGRSESSEEARARLAAALPETLDPTLREAIDASPIIIEGKLMTRDFTKPWSSAAPRVAFLGDAAHPLRPTGEGTALALEDAWTVGKLASGAATADAFCSPETLREYEALRRARVEAVSEAVRAAADRFYQKESGSARPMSVREAFEAHPIECTSL